MTIGINVCKSFANYKTRYGNLLREVVNWNVLTVIVSFPLSGLEIDGEFYEHIFLDKHLADFPKEGPIRHFMELVTCGLSKNPYLSVKQKVEHIQWFRDYFKEKEELLKEIEAHEKEALVQIENISKWKLQKSRSNVNNHWEVAHHNLERTWFRNIKTGNNGLIWLANCWIKCMFLCLLMFLK